MRALIIGGSVAGLFTALLLRQQRWQVDVFERSADALESRGAGIAAHPELIDALTTAGVDADAALPVTLVGRKVLDREGRVVDGKDLTQRVTSWDLLFRHLRAALPDSAYHRGARFRDLEQSGGQVTATFDDGRRETADLLVGADGVGSEVRECLLPDVGPDYAGYVAWRGMVPEAQASADTRAALGRHIVFCLPPGEQSLSYPVAGEGGDADPAARRLNWVWYRQARAPAEQDALLTDRDGRRRAVSVPPKSMRAEVVATMRADAARRLAPPHAELAAHIEHPFLQAIFDLQCPEIVFDRALLLGDAAFVARPHTGYGVTKAAEDAIALANAFAATGDDIDSAITGWGAARLAAGRAMVERGRALGRVLVADRDAADGDAFGFGRSVPGTVLGETALAGQMLDAARAG